MFYVIGQRSVLQITGVMLKRNNTALQWHYISYISLYKYLLFMEQHLIISIVTGKILINFSRAVVSFMLNIPT